MVEFVRERGERGGGDGGVREEWGGAGVCGGGERGAGIGGVVGERGDVERDGGGGGGGGGGDDDDEDKGKDKEDIGEGSRARSEEVVDGPNGETVSEGEK